MPLLVAPFLALLVLACSSDGKITAYTEPPEVTITTPADGAEVLQAVAVSMRGLVVDKEFSDSLSSLNAQWSVDGEAICEGSFVDDGGNVDCVHTFSVAGTVELALTVTNPDGASATATSEVVVLPNAAPSVTIELPDPTGRYYADQLISFLAFATDSEDAATDLFATWTSDLEGTLDIDDTPDADGTLSGDAVLGEGEHLITLQVEDTTGLIGTDTIIVDIGPPNSPPSCAITSPDNNDSFEIGGTVLFEGMATDPDIDADELTVTWSSSVDGVLNTGSPTSAGTMTFGTSALSTATHTITLLVEDEVGGSCSDAILITMGDGPDVEIDLPTSDSVENEGESVAFEATVTDPDDPPTTLDITWESSRDGVLSTARADSSGRSSFALDTLSVGNHTITVTAVDPDGFYAVESVRLVINGLPDAPEVEIDPSAPASDDALTAIITADATDPEGHALSYAYTWRRNGGTTGYVTDTVPWTATTRGETWSVTVTPSDPYGAGASGSASVVIGNSRPTVASATLTPTSPVEGDTLTCTAGTTADTDGDAVSLSYQWTVSGTTIGATGSTLSSTWFAKGDTVRCTITPNDGYEDGPAVSSSEVSVGNTAPSIATVTLSPTTAYESSTFTCSPGAATDADGDSVSFTYNWVVGGVSLGLDSASLSGAWFDKTDAVYCTATPSDGTASGTTITSNVVTVRNTVPVLASLTLSPSTATERSTLACSPGGTSDDDGDIVNLSYGWLVDGADVGVSSTSLTGTWFGKGDSVQCYATPNDGTDNGSTVYSSTVSIDNTAPSATYVEISPVDPYTDDTLTATASGWSDPDGDSEGYSWQWYVDGVAVSSGGTSQTLLGTRFEKHQVVYVVATPTDGTASGSPITSGTVEILNSPPAAPLVQVTPTDAEPEDDLTCGIATPSTDADGDTVDYRYEWWVDGIKSSVTTPVLSYSYTEDGDTWTCRVTPYDDDEDGTSASDAQEVVDRTAPDQPVISAIDEYRNTTSVALSGTAEAGSTVTVTMDCTDGTLSDVDVVASAGGTWSTSFTMDRGEECDFVAYATDTHGNVSGLSNTVTTESCNPYDTREDSLGYGDTCVESIDEWSVLTDAGTTVVEIQGNIIDTTDVDWYVIDTSQSVVSAGTNVYNFEVTLTTGSSDYNFEIYRGSCATSDLECPSAPDLTDYSFFAQDVGGAEHSIPSDSRYCYTGSPFYNNCDDLSDVYYIKVERISSALSCQHYELSISNGAW